MDGEPPQEEDFSQIPLVERSQHKNWKARLSAYTDVISKSAKTASDTDPFFRPYVTDGPLLKKWVTDANAVAQEKGIEAVLAIVQNSGESSARCRSDVVPSLVEKALGAARAGTKKKGTDLCAMFVEVENTGDGVMSDLIAGLDAKQPKIVAGCITCLKEIVESFGVQAIGNIKPLMKNLPKIFAHSDKTVRAEGSALVLALYTYLGPAIQPSLSDLKPLQIAELQKSFDALDAEKKGAGTGRPTRFTRKAQREREASSGQADAGGDEEVEDAAPIDPRDLMDAVDISKLFPSDLDERLASSKWKDRLEALEEVNKVISDPKNAKIQEGNVDVYGSLAQTLGTKCKSDANVNVVIEAAKVIEGLSRGLGRPFGRYRASLMSGMLERLKERKTTVVDALGKALDGLASTVSFSDLVEDILTSLKSKNPQVKELTLKFLHRTLCSTLDAPSKDQVKPIAEALVSLLADSAETVRSSAADCLGTMMKLLGERAFNPYIEGVGELQMAKVKEAFEKAQIKYKAGVKSAPKMNGTAPVPVKRAGPNLPSKAPTKTSAVPSSPPLKAAGAYGNDAFENEISPPKRAPPARLLAKAGAPKATPTEYAPPTAPASIARPAPAAPAAAVKPAPKPPSAGSSKAGPSKTLATSPSEPVKYRYTSEDAAAKAQESIPAEYHTNLADAAWKVRLESMEEMIKWAEGSADSVDSEVIFRFLGKTPGWGEKNFQVSAKVYDVMKLVAERSSTFGKPSAALAIGHLSDKLGDLKLKKPAGDAMTAFAEKTSLAFVLAQAYEPMSKQKAPKAQADALTWIKQQLTEFGIAGIPLRDLISFVKTALGSPNALVRSSATQVLVTIKIFVGGDISGFIEDLNPQLLSTINSEFDKASSQTAPEPTRTQADLQESSGGVGGKAAKGGGADPLDDLIPRVDLDKLVNQTSVITDSKSDAWKTRKEAFEALSALLDIKSNSRLKPNMGEIAGVLKKATADTNLAVKMLALGIISKIATGMGQPFDKQTRQLTGPVAMVCADQKTTTRSAAITTLSAMMDACGGLDSMFGGLATALESPNPALRATVLGWLAERLTAEPPASSADLTPLAGPIITCLEDRNGDVRKGATAILPFVVASAGYDHVMDQTSRLKPASKATIVPLINNARSVSSSSAPAASAPAAVSSKTPAAAVKPKAPASKAQPSSPTPPAIPKPSGIAPPGRSLAMKALSNAPTARPPSTTSDDRPTGLPRPKVIGTSKVQAATVQPQDRVIPFISSDSLTKASRLKKDSVRWLLEIPPKPDLAEYLHNQMESHASPEIIQLCFSKDHRAEEDYMAALSTMAEFYDSESVEFFGSAEDDLRAIQMANTDLAFKYSALKLLSNNTQLANRCLEVILNVINLFISSNEKFSDVEAKLFVPALIYKLGDSKFVAKLTPIFESLDKIMAGSQVVQMLVQYGLEDKSAGKTCKNESLALIEKAYRKRGNILKGRDDRSFYETLAKCVNDTGTRNAALSVMALLLIQGGSKSLDAVIDSLPTASKDMLANRKASMATTRNGPAIAKPPVESSIPAPSPRLRKPVSRSETPSRQAVSASTSSRASPAPSSSRIPPSPGRTSMTSSPSPKAPGRTGIPRPSGIPRAGASAIPSLASAPPARDLFSAKPSLQPLTRPTSSKPVSDHMRLINGIRLDDLDAAVDSLKQLQTILMKNPESLKDDIPTFVDTLVDELDRAFTPKDNLNDSSYFRLVKHLSQTLSAITENEDLLGHLQYDNVYPMYSSLTLHLVESDLMGGNHRELSKFFNLILIQVMAQTDRFIIFRTMFRLLLQLSRNFSAEGVMQGDESASQADLVIKCLWKRSKVLDDDFKSGRITVGAMLGIVEELMQGIGPSEWRKRAVNGIALGDMPLRTSKTIIQKICTYCQASNQEIYDVLLSEFGDNASDTVVYSYVFRLAGRTQRSGSPEDQEEGQKPATRPKSSSSQGTISSMRGASKPKPSHSQSTSETAPQEESPSLRGETEAARMIRVLIGNPNHQKHLDSLYQYMKASQQNEDDVYTAIAAMPSTSLQTYMRRALDQRRSEDNPSPSRPDSHSSPKPNRSPERLSDQPKAAPRRSMAMRPMSIAVDRTAPADAQLADYKNLFFSKGNDLRTSQNHGHERSGEPLSEIGQMRDNGLNADVD